MALSVREAVGSSLENAKTGKQTETSCGIAVLPAMCITWYIVDTPTNRCHLCLFRRRAKRPCGAVISKCTYQLSQTNAIFKITATLIKGTRTGSVYAEV